MNKMAKVKRASKAPQLQKNVAKTTSCSCHYTYHDSDSSIYRAKILIARQGRLRDSLISLAQILLHEIVT